MQTVKNLFFLFFFAVLFSVSGGEEKSPAQQDGASLVFFLRRVSGRATEDVLDLRLQSMENEKTEFKLVNSLETREIGIKLETAVQKLGSGKAAAVKLEAFVSIPQEGVFRAPGEIDINRGVMILQTRNLPCGKFTATVAMTTPEKEIFIPFLRPDFQRYTQKKPPRDKAGICQMRILKITERELRKIAPGFLLSAPDPETVGKLALNPKCEHRPMLTLGKIAEADNPVHFKGMPGYPERTIGFKASAGAVRPGVLKIEMSDVKLAGVRISEKSEIPGRHGTHPVFETIYFKSFIPIPESGKWILLAGSRSASAGTKTLFEDGNRKNPTFLFIFFRSIH